MKIEWETIEGRKHAGELIEIDNGTGIVRLDNGSTTAVNLDGMFSDEEYERLAKIL